MKKSLLILCAAAMTIVSCNDDGTGPAPATTANFTVTIENVAAEKAFLESGVFNTPAGDTDPGPATPGKMYQFTINAGRNQHLSFATMLAATNDLFFGPGDDGIALYDDNGDPISGDITDQIYLWDAGTEVNEEPAVGPNTVTNQSGPDTGEDENGNVLKIDDVTNGVDFDYPAVSDVINITITHTTGTEFEVTIKDLSTAVLNTSEGDRPAPLSPGVWVVHNGANPLYTEGQPDLGQGIEAIAEDGNPGPLGDYTADNTGITYPASPGVWVVHQENTMPLFTEGAPDYGDGIEDIAEDGSVGAINNNINALDGLIEGAIFNTPVGSSNPGPIKPGSKYQFSFEAESGQNLSFATMLAATNDVFFAPLDSGIPLFDANGDPISDDITSQIYLWDAGTEVNEQPSIGPNTVTNQPTADTGTDEHEPVRLLSSVNDGFSYPAVNSVLKVTITAN